MKLFQRAVAILCLLVLSPLAYSQTACPQGVTAGSAQCGPSGASMLGNGTTTTSPAPKQPQARWRLTWGAMAHDVAKALIGTSTGQKSKRDARRKAISKCESVGGTECKIILEYHNQCAVIAEPIEDIGRYTPVSQIGPSIPVATDLALKSCPSYNDGHACKIIYSNCTEPYLVYD